MADTPKLDPKTERLVRQHAKALSVYLDMAVADATQAHLDWRRAARERMERLHPVNEPPDVSLCPVHAGGRRRRAVLRCLPPATRADP